MQTTMPDSAKSTGLAAAKAAARRAADGPNALPHTKRRSPFRIILNVLREPMLALLLAGGVVYLSLGSRAEALIAIAAVQEARTDLSAAAVMAGSNGALSALQLAILHPSRMFALIPLVPLGYRPPSEANSAAPMAIGLKTR